MKVLLLSDIYSEHTEKWALGLASNNIEVGLFSFNKATYNWYKDKKNITLLFESEFPINTESRLSKLTYVKFVKKLKAAIKLFKPDILHAHYATSYGLIGSLSGFHPYVISAWGTDVMKFPQKNFLNKAVLSRNLKRADAVCATSFTIEGYLKQVTNKKIHIIPFGVDTDEFSKREVESDFEKDCFVIGSIKSLEDLYNIDVLIQSFYQLKQKYKAKKMKLVIIGEGSSMESLKKLVTQLNITEDVVFTGRVQFNQISRYFNMIDVLVNISSYESFGVSVIEAMACQKAVVVTNTGGLKEIIESDKLGTLVEICNIEQTTQAIEKYLNDPDLKERTGILARKSVVEKYNWQTNIKQMISVYESVIKNKTA